MANKQLFQSANRRQGGSAAAVNQMMIDATLPETDTVNLAGAPAYKFRDAHALAQYAATGCLNGTFYASAESQLDNTLKLCAKVNPEMVARIAVYCRKEGYMKDMPALLTAFLCQNSPEMFKKAFPKVIDDVKMLRNFVQMIRSGVTGRRSLGHMPKRLVGEWLNNCEGESLFRQSIGQDPSLKDVIKLSRPRPGTDARAQLYRYLIGKDFDFEKLPQLVQEYEAFKKGRQKQVPKVPFRKLDALPLSKEQWTEIARNATWQTTRMNLNTYARHGVFEVKGMEDTIAKRLRDPELIAKSRVFPYQLLAAYLNTDGGNIPFNVREALQDAMEIATSNVPKVEGKVVVCPDVSGSMSCSISGWRATATSKVRCVDVAALVNAVILRNNPDATVIPFEGRVCKINLNPRDTVMTNAERLASIGGGATNCSAPLRLLNQQEAKADLVVFVSDNESWVDANPYYDSTAMLREWEILKMRNPNARMVCLDITPNDHTQAPERQDILNIGGFADNVFGIIADFAAGRLEEGYWVKKIEEVEL